MQPPTPKKVCRWPNTGKVRRKSKLSSTLTTPMYARNRRKNATPARKWNKSRSSDAEVACPKADRTRSQPARRQIPSGGHALSRARTGFNAYRQSMARAKGNREEGHDRRVGQESKPISLSNCREQQRRFHHREASPDAHARTSAKRKISKTRNAAAAKGIHPPTFRIKSFRIREEARIAMREPLKNKNVGACRDTVATNLDIADGAPANSPGGGIKAHRFLDHHLGVGQAGEIRKSRRVSAKNLIKLGDERLFD